MFYDDFAAVKNGCLNFTKKIILLKNPWGEPEPKKPIQFNNAAQEWFGQFSGMPSPQASRNVIIFALCVLPILWLASGIYQVNPDEQGVVLRFGRYVRTTQSGLNWHIPYPVESVLTPQVTKINRIEIGASTTEDGALKRDNTPEDKLLMLTGDENIIDVKFSVLWRIKDARKYLFNIKTPRAMVYANAESAMRAAVGQSKLEVVLTNARQTIEDGVRKDLQTILDTYDSGIEVVQVAVQEVDPPAQVIQAFRDVQSARADQERLRNDADAYANKIIPEARGEAGKLLEEAEGYKQQTVAEAQGQAQRFLKLHAEYVKARDITTQRLYLETLEQVLSSSPKVLMGNGAQSLLPIMPLLKNTLTPTKAAP